MTVNSHAEYWLLPSIPQDPHEPFDIYFAFPKVLSHHVVGEFLLHSKFSFSLSTYWFIFPFEMDYVPWASVLEPGQFSVRQVMRAPSEEQQFRPWFIRVQRMEPTQRLVVFELRLAIPNLFVHYFSQKFEIQIREKKEHMFGALIMKSPRLEVSLPSDSVEWVHDAFGKVGFCRFY